MTLEELNNLSDRNAKTSLLKCCGSTYWVKNVIGYRPFLSIADLIEKADLSWNMCTRADAFEAFDHHPKIGDISSLEKKFTSTSDWAQNEQKSVKKAAIDTIRKIALGNKAYEEKFGYIFIVFASGKTALQMLEILEQRLNNNVEDELQIAMSEQHKITILRLNKLMT